MYKKKGRDSKFYSFWYYGWKSFKKNKLAMIALIFLTTLFLLAIFFPIFAPTNYDDQTYLGKAYGFPDKENWFGVDAVGRDCFTRVIYGARVSLGIGLMSALVSSLIGVPLGALAGYKGGKVDWFIMRVIEVMSVIPPVLVGIVIATVTGGGILNIVFICAVFYWVGIARLVRGQIISLKNEEYVQAAISFGASSWFILKKHLIPNTISQIIVGLVLILPSAIMMEASLSFLGLGVQTPLPSWGQMISNGLYYIFYYWHLPFFPALMLSLTILSISLVGDGLRDALDPH